MSAYAPQEVSDTISNFLLDTDNLVSEIGESVPSPHSVLGHVQNQDQDDEEYHEAKEYQTPAIRSNPTVISFNIWEILKKGSINLVLPFINGIMLGFGEILAHEIGFKYGYVGARVQPPRRRLQRKPNFI